MDIAIFILAIILIILLIGIMGYSIYSVYKDEHPEPSKKERLSMVEEDIDLINESLDCIIDDYTERLAILEKKTDIIADGLASLMVDYLKTTNGDEPVKDAEKSKKKEK